MIHIQKIQGYNELRKIDNAYIINTDDKNYQTALNRLNTRKKIKEFEKRLGNIEETFNIIQQKLSSIESLLKDIK